MKNVEQELQMSLTAITAICASLAAVLPKDVVIPTEQDQLAGFFTTQLGALSGRATKAESDLLAANETAAKVPGLEQKIKDLEASNKTLTDANAKLTTDNKALSEKEQDLDKRANAKFREFAGAQGLNPDAAPKVTGSKQPGQGGTSTRAQLLEQYNALTDAQARADFYAANEKAMFGRN